MPPPLTTAKFIQKAQKIHGDLFDYSKVVYTTTYAPVLIGCRACGQSWEQPPRNHLKGHGCKSCAHKNSWKNKRAERIRKFRTKAEEVHGTRSYTYDMSTYIDVKTPMSITCTNCGGVFRQTPDAHMSGSGCSPCSFKHASKRKVERAASDFKSKAKTEHGDAYAYDEVDYRGARKKVKIWCKSCASYFYQSPTSHLSGYGCADCSNSKHESAGEAEWISTFPGVVRHFKVAGTRYIVDGYCPHTNTVYEYFGDFWHGNPDVYDQEGINPRTKTTFGHLYAKTMEKLDRLENHGFTVVWIWEKEWKELSSEQDHTAV